MRHHRPLAFDRWQRRSQHSNALRRQHHALCAALWAITRPCIWSHAQGCIREGRQCGHRHALWRPRLLPELPKSSRTALLSSSNRN